MGTVIYGLMQDAEHLDEVVDDLESQGFCFDEISLVMPQDLGHRLPIDPRESAGKRTGGLLGLLLGIGSVPVPGNQQVVTTGPVSVAIGQRPGGVVGSLAGLGISVVDAGEYAEAVGAGRILIAVHTSDQDWAHQANMILGQHAVDRIASAKEPSGGQ